MAKGADVGWDTGDGPAITPPMPRSRGARASRRPVRRRSWSPKAALVWVAVLAAAVFALGGYWTVRGVQHVAVVDRGPGLVSDPVVHCYNSTHHRRCEDDVHLHINAGGKNVTLSNVKGLYNTVRSNPGQTLAVDHVFYDTTNSEVNKVVYGATTYGVETTKGAFLALGIGALVLGVIVAVAGGSLIHRKSRKMRVYPAGA